MKRLVFAVLTLLTLSTAADAAAKKGGLAGVAEDGTLVRGANVKKAKKIGLGFYRITFERRVADCYFLVSPTNFDAKSGVDISVAASVYPVGNNRKSLIVTTWSGVLADSLDHAFILKVEC